jgi:hypothetical protein
MGASGSEVCEKREVDGDISSSLPKASPGTGGRGEVVVEEDKHDNKIITHNTA